MVKGVEACSIPEQGLLRRYANAHDFVDCYVVGVDRSVSLEQFVFAFYTTWLFKLERFVLRLVSKPSTDAHAQQLAAGSSDRFSAWDVEARAPEQLLMRDFRGNTRSWFMIAKCGGATRLYFGSAVIARTSTPQRRPVLGKRFRMLLAFHRLYSRLLLSAAEARLRR